jgi:hypothetical protein
MVSRGSFPHPVLDDSDDIDSVFKVFNLSFSPSVEDIEVRFQLRIDNEEIISLIKRGMAKISCNWMCGSTMIYRDLEVIESQTYADSKGYVAYIDQREARGKVKLGFKVLATRMIEGYRPSNLNKDYGDARFDIEIGSVLADAGEADFYPGKLYDPLSPPIGSCFRFVSEKRISKVTVKFDEDDCVIVSFPEKSFLGLSGLAHRKELQVGMAVLPALAETLHFIKSQAMEGGIDEIEAKDWYQSIMAMMDKQKLSLEESPLQIAQVLLGNPIVKVLESEEGEDDD